jgi:hypothetical protein
MPGTRAKLPKFALIKVSKKSPRNVNVKLIATGTKARVTAKRRDYKKEHPREKNVRVVRVPIFRKA